MKPSLSYNDLERECDVTRIRTIPVNKRPLAPLQIAADIGRTSCHQWISILARSREHSPTRIPLVFVEKKSIEKSPAFVLFSFGGRQGIFVFFPALSGDRRLFLHRSRGNPIRFREDVGHTGDPKPSTLRRTIRRCPRITSRATDMRPPSINGSSKGRRSTVKPLPSASARALQSSPSHCRWKRYSSPPSWLAFSYFSAFFPISMILAINISLKCDTLTT